MMKLNLVVRRYGEAYAEYAKETIGLDRAIGEVKALKKIITDNPEFLGVLVSPSVTISEKFAFVDDVLKKYFSEELTLFLKLAIEKNRVMMLVDMLDYIRVNYAHGEAVDAILKSAYPLDLKDIEEIKAKLEKKLDKILHFYFELDASILGGVQVIVGNTLIDGSLKRRLEDLREKIVSMRMG